MRPVLHGDVSAAARVLYPLSPGRRAMQCRRMIREAEIADAHARTTGRVHRSFGDGSLICAARKYALAPEPRFDDPVYCRCFALVLLTLAAHFGGRTAPDLKDLSQTHS